MVRKSLCVVVLITMTLHCASRLGLLSILHKNRHSIAYAFGIISEIPITLCNSDYDFGSGLKIASDEGDLRMPALAQAYEINLFFVSAYDLPLSTPTLVSVPLTHVRPIFNYPGPQRSVFHPPSLI